MYRPPVRRYSRRKFSFGKYIFATIILGFAALVVFLSQDIPPHQQQIVKQIEIK